LTKYQLLYIITPINTKKRKFGKSNRFGCEKEAETNAAKGTKHKIDACKPASSKIKGAAVKIRHINNKADQFFRI
jgi:hypothetical protein